MGKKTAKPTEAQPIGTFVGEDLPNPRFLFTWADGTIVRAEDRHTGDDLTIEPGREYNFTDARDRQLAEELIAVFTEAKVTSDPTLDALRVLLPE